ncbi:hypothetical protein C8D77_101853 [Mesorhizobium loti]|jgi:hypothetical protein|uniref:Uncharacterized protein n=1 Tax=Rhizobium loti TaxID=381 RepID=A0A8E2WGT3_RHILI|nr:hypothetical protein C8D77_101853 [Mesorhizobium loti]
MHKNLGRLSVFLAAFHQGRPRSCTCQMASANVVDRPVSADHGAAAADFGFADLGVTRFQHFRLGKLRFSFAE